MEIAETVSWSASAEKSLYRDQALGNGIDCQEKTFERYSTEQRRTVGSDKALSRDFSAVQRQTCLCHGPNVSLPTSNYNPLRASRFELKLFRQRSRYYGKGSASIYK
jgi:hypothetical protein